MAKSGSTGDNLPGIPLQWQALKLRNGHTIRVTPDKRASVLDAIEAATGARNPRSIWDRYGMETPATADTAFSESRAPLRWVLMYSPSSRSFITGPYYPRTYNSCKFLG